MNANWREKNLWARNLAETRDKRILGAAPTPEKDSLSSLHTWTINQFRLVAARNVNVFSLVQRKKEGAQMIMICGKTGETAFEREDGLRCQFKMNFRQEKKSLKLLSYALTVQAPKSASPQFLRWEFTFEKSKKADAAKDKKDATRTDEKDNPLFEPQSHLHPGHRNIRVPAPVLSPKELIVLFLSLEKWW